MSSSAQSNRSNMPPIPVTADNFIRAESDMYFAAEGKAGHFGRLGHYRELMPIDHQVVVRINRDTLYSAGVFDLNAGPVTVTMPDAGKRFMSLMVIDEDQFAHSVFYGAGTHTYSKDEIGTRYALLAVRILVNPDDPQDLKEVHALQDKIKVEQANKGQFEVPNWDQESQKRVREALLVLNSTIPNTKYAFGTRDEVDPIRHLIATASAWGGNPDKDAIYLNVTPKLNDGKTVYKLNFKDVPVDGFWSVTVYNAEGYIPANDRNIYSFNNLTAKKDVDGSVTIQFGACDDKCPNCLPIVAGWNYMVRLYRPRAEILNGKWKFPDAQPVH